MFDSNSRLHIFVAGSDSALWDNRGVLSSGTYNHKWHRLGIGIKGPVFSTLETGLVQLPLAMVRGTDNSLWMADIVGSSDPRHAAGYTLAECLLQSLFCINRHLQ